MLSEFLEAFRFLTILPLPRAKKETSLARAMLFFPLVGFLIGIATLTVTQLLSLDLFLRLEALSLITIPIFLSGGLHIDGFSDFLDGFFGGKDKNEILTIMRDPRIGVWGALGVFLLLFWKWELLASLANRGPALLFALTSSRWAQVVLSYFLPYANPQAGLGSAVAKKVTLRELVGASAFFAVIVFVSRGSGVLCFLVLLPFLAGLGWLFHKRVGGVTGDLLGAASEMTELFIFLVLFLIKAGSFR